MFEPERTFQYDLINDWLLVEIVPIDKLDYADCSSLSISIL